MSATVIELPEPHPGQQRVLDTARRFNVVCCGRRWGKSLLGLERLSVAALEGQPVAWFSPSYKALGEVWRLMRATLYPATSAANASEHRIDLVTGGTIDMWSMDSDAVENVRGRPYALVVIDEAAKIAELRRIFAEIIRPTLTDLKGDAWFLSTPRGYNDFHSFWLRGQEPGDWASWQAPATENPYIDPAEVEAAREDMTAQQFAQEYLAEFVSLEGGVFRGVLDATTAPADQAPQGGHAYVIGCDWARSATGDYTAFVVCDTTARQVVALDRFRGVDFALQRARLQGLAQRWKPAQIVAEANSLGQPIIEALQRDGLPIRPFTTTNASKDAAISALALAFEQRRIQIPDDTALIGELLAYEASTTATGMPRYSAPPGGHDDLVMALALAWQGAAAAPVTIRRASAPNRWATPGDTAHRIGFRRTNDF